MASKAAQKQTPILINYEQHAACADCGETQHIRNLEATERWGLLCMTCLEERQEPVEYGEHDNAWLLEDVDYLEEDGNAP